MTNRSAIILTYERALDQVYKYEQGSFNSTHNFLSRCLETKATLMLEAGTLIAGKLIGNPVEDTSMLYAQYNELINRSG